MQTITQQLRTGVWHGDEPLELDFPDNWRVTTLWPKAPPPLSDSQLRSILERPVGQPPLRELCKGKSRPLVVVDDLNRPTPCDRVLPHVLRHFEDAGISPRKVSVLVACGTHRPPDRSGILKKVGAAGLDCGQLLAHDHTRDVVKVGATSFGTPVLVNQLVLASDFVVGIGGVYPNHTAGFGGGSKLALGVLGTRSIMHLHYRHASVGWGGDGCASPFRQDLDQIARMIGLRSSISVVIGPDREIVRMDCGDAGLYFADAVRFAGDIYRTQPPGDADVVIANAYPGDLSVLFTKIKGFAPFSHCAPPASRVSIASCPEGVGHHGLFPHLAPTRFHLVTELRRRVAVSGVARVTVLAASRVRQKVWTRLASRTGNGSVRHVAHLPRRAVWLYRTAKQGAPLPPELPGIHVRHSWPEIVDAIRHEQGRRPLDVVLYPCASLQSLAG